MSLMNEEYYISYYDKNNRYSFTIYYEDKKEVEVKAKELESQGFNNIKIHTFRY